MTAQELMEWSESRNAQIFSLPHPRWAVIRIQSLSDPNNRVEVQHWDAERAIDVATMVFDLPHEMRIRLGMREMETC